MTEERGVEHAHEAGRKDDQRHESNTRKSACRQGFHAERAAEGAHNHDAFEAQVDDAGVLTEASAQSHHGENGSKDQGILN